MIYKKSWLLAILAIFGLTACATMQGGGQNLPLPNDISIVPPSPDLPKDLAAFSGKWAGRWSHGIDAMMIFEKIDKTEAVVLYSWGDNNAQGIKAGFDRKKCQIISDSKPVIVMPQKGWGDQPAYLKMEDLNTVIGERKILHGSWTGGGWTRPNSSTFYKVKFQRAN